MIYSFTYTNKNSGCNSKLLRFFRHIVKLLGLKDHLDCQMILTNKCYQKANHWNTNDRIFLHIRHANKEGVILAVGLASSCGTVRGTNNIGKLSY